MKRNYGYSPVSNITAITDTVSPALSQLFSYDKLDRLTFATGDYGDFSYSYDKIGNRLQEVFEKGASRQTQDYQYGFKAHRLASITGVKSYSYDANGNTLSNGTSTFSYNERNRMASATTGGATSHYQVNALGQRVSKRQGRSTTHYIYDLQGKLIAEATGASGEMQVEYAYLDGEPVAQWRGSASPPPPPTKPGKPSIVSPTGTINTTDPSYQWQPIGGVIEYQVQVTDKVRGKRVLNKKYRATAVCSSTECEITPAGASIEAGEKHQWRVRARNAAGWGKWSAQTRFNIVLTPRSVNLLSNGGFEQKLTDWLSCADTGSTKIITDASAGRRAVRIKGADCLYQEFTLEPGKRYTVECDARVAGFNSISLIAQSSEYVQLATAVITPTGNRYQTYSDTLEVPAGGVIGALTLYSEGTAKYDECSVVEG